MTKVFEISWSKFRRRFEAKCKEVDMTYIQAQKFLTLTQSVDLVKEYSNKFNHLVRYALEITNTKIRQIKKFVYGLNPIIA